MGVLSAYKSQGSGLARSGPDEKGRKAMSGRIRHRGTLGVPTDDGSGEWSERPVPDRDTAEWRHEPREARPRAPLTPSGPGEEPPVRSLVLVTVLGVAGVGLVVACLVLVIGLLVSAQPSSTPPGSSALGAPADAATLARDVAPALVDVNTVLAAQGLNGSGTGMVLSGDGFVLTNNHVIEQGSSLSVTDIGNGKTYKATVVGYDIAEDVAVLKMTNASGLQSVRTGDSSKVRIGAPVVAIGNAQGRGGAPSYAAGSVTALNQSIVASDEVGAAETLTGLIEADARIYPGYSGGPLVNGTGAVIAMTTAGTETLQSSGAAKAAYAIPINDALALAAQIESGRASSTVHLGPTAYLGVQVESVVSGSGALIVGLVPGAPAVRAGLAVGDTITAVANHAVASPSSLTEILIGKHPGDSVRLDYLDPSGRAHVISMRLGTGPPQ